MKAHKDCNHVFDGNDVGQIICRYCGIPTSIEHNGVRYTNHQTWFRINTQIFGESIQYENIESTH